MYAVIDLTVSPEMKLIGWHESGGEDDIPHGGMNIPQYVSLAPRRVVHDRSEKDNSVPLK